eukprot:365023-Chlamydomonas_euryale.AAC.2
MRGAPPAGQPMFIAAPRQPRQRHLPSPPCEPPPPPLVARTDAVVEALPYVGQIAGPGNALVPSGELGALLESYDRQRVAVPSPVPVWEWGWTDSAEVLNGRLAMVAILAILAVETMTGRSITEALFKGWSM